jgi:hypothetical protein
MSRIKGKKEIGSLGILRKVQKKSKKKKSRKKLLLASSCLNY